MFRAALRMRQDDAHDGQGLECDASLAYTDSPFILFDRFCTKVMVLQEPIWQISKALIALWLTNVKLWLYKWHERFE